MCSEACGARVVCQRLVIELHRAAHQLDRCAAVDGLDLEDHVVGERLLVGAQIEQALDRRPLALHGLQVLAPVVERLLGEGVGDEVAGRLPVFISDRASAKRGSSASFGNAEVLEGVADAGAGREDAQVDGAAVGGR